MNEFQRVKIISKIKPENVQIGTGIDFMDFEGRNLRLDFKKFSVMSLYLPSGTNLDRLDIKFKFMDDFKDNISISKKEVAASYQQAIVDSLVEKMDRAVRHTKSKTCVIAGGVAANKKIRETLTKLCNEENFEAIFPPINLCGDNAAMIAMVGLEKFKLKQFNNLDYPAKPRWQLDENATFLKGSGVRL